MTTKRKAYKDRASCIRTKKLQIECKTNHPKGADWFIDGHFYKMGAHGFIYIFRRPDNRWIKSGRTIKSIFMELRGDDKRCFSINKKAKGEYS